MGPVSYNVFSLNSPVHINMQQLFENKKNWAPETGKQLVKKEMKDLAKITYIVETVMGKTIRDAQPRPEEGILQGIRCSGDSVFMAF